MTILERMNKLASPFSMYKGMSLGLLGIWFVAVLLAFVGMLDLSPLGMIVSMLVLTGSVYLTSLLCGKLFSIPTHGESSLITGLILALIFFPATDLPGLVVLLFVGMIAGASKYIVTWKGRHVFNPAAFAAVVIGLTQLGAASWWVATPVLTPIVFAVIAISLYQSKRFDVAGLYLGIMIVALTVQFLLLGASFGQAVWLLMSWPILFVAGVMLTEPLTLPPRKWQMYIVAIVVAVLMLVPIQIGAYQVGPALALVVGNIVALIFAQRRAITLVFKERRPLTPTTDELVFTTDAPFGYEPGQYVELNLPHKKADFRGSRRRFSVTSAPGEKEVTFGIKFADPSSSFKTELRALQKGATIGVTQLAGDFILPKDATKPLLFVAGGIGVTPFVSHLRSLKPGERDITVVYALSNPEEIAYTDVLVESGAHVIIVAPSKPKDLPKGWVYIKGSRIDFAAAQKHVSALSSRLAYVSGPTPFVQVQSSTLRKLGVRRVKTDYFAGY